MSSPAAPASVNAGLKLFLSYDRNDIKAVRELYKRLQADGFSPWMDDEKLRAGKWEAQILQAIHDADGVLICLSRHSTSRRGYLEIEMASILDAAKTKSNHFILPVRLEDSPVPKVLEPFYYVDLFAPDGYQRLLRMLNDPDYYGKESVTDFTPDSFDSGQVIVDRKSSARSSGQFTDAVAASGSFQNETDPVDQDQQQQLTEQQRAQQQQQQETQQSTFFGLLALGSKGDDVSRAQHRLKELGFDVVADGNFGPATRQAVLSFQRDQDLRSKDGLIGPGTWSALFSTSSPEKETTKEPDAKPNTEESTASAATEARIKEGLAEEARERNALNDKPIDDVDRDTLGFKDYVFALRDFVASESTTTPLTISINGAWGSGKSSLMGMLKGQLEPPTPRGLWRVQLKWLAGWCLGTFLAGVGKALIKVGYRDADYIRLGLSYDPEEDVTKDNFETLFARCVEHSIRKDFSHFTENSEHPAPVDEERRQRFLKTRFWARQAARRRKMTPRQHPTVWFNAWKFNQQEQVWAALAIAVLSQLKNKYSFFARLAFLTQLTLKRTDKLRTLSLVLRKFIVPIAIAVVVALYKINQQKLASFFQLPPQFSWLAPGNLVWLAPVLAAVWQALKAIDDPFKLPIEELVAQPDYQGKIGFIGTFEQDFQRIVQVAVRRSLFWRPRKLIIFIDDLDRCGPTQTAGVVEAINLFLDSVGCVFVLGMDMNAVAISIEIKYEELTKRMRDDAPDSISPGILFLDKIVQIPFNVPRPNKPYISALVKQITQPEVRELPSVRSPLMSAWIKESEPMVIPGSRSPQSGAPRAARTVDRTPEPAKTDRAGFAQDDVREAITFAAGLLKENPRQVKRFINLFRLQVYIADERGMLSDRHEFDLTPRKLAVWVAWYMQWPEILRMLSSSAQTEDMLQHLALICEKHVQKKHNPAGETIWLLKDSSAYLSTLRSIREAQEGASSHWSRLPWPLWTRDADFLHCLKVLESYWLQPFLLESILDMTQTTNISVPSPATTPPPIDIANPSGPPASPAVPA